MTWDERWLVAVNQGWSHPAADALFLWVSDQWTFSLPLLALILADALRRAGTRGLVLWLVLVAWVGVGDQVGNGVKALTQEPRPCFSVSHLLLSPGGAPMSPCLGSPDKGSPSTHALNFALAATFLLLATPWRRWHWAMHLALVLVCLSRVYLGKHFPSQVAEGLLLGVGLGMLAGAGACYYRLCLPGAPGYRRPRT